MRLLNLFSGTDSVAKPWRQAGHEVISVDCDPTFNPEICDDILQTDYTKIPIPDVIWSSPPCDQYSMARTRAKTPRNLVLADKLVARALEIIHYFEALNPKLIWFMENGNSTLLWKRAVAKDLTTYVKLDYCQYGLKYRKRTRIAHSDNLHWIPRALCNPKTCHACDSTGKHFMTAQRGPCAGRIHDVCTLNQLHALPHELTQEILQICCDQTWV